VKISKRGAGFQAGFEGIFLYAYPDPGTNGEPWTIGIGATRADGQGVVRKGDRITLERAIARFRTTMENSYGPSVSRAIRRDLAQNEFDALASFHHNTGAIHSGSVDDKLNRGDDAAALATWASYKNAGGQVMAGLVRRRTAEIKLFRNNDYGTQNITLRTDPSANARSLRPEDLPWDIEAPAPVVTVDFPLIVVPPLPERGQRGNFLLDLITFLWSKLK
jgi:lysozyme